MQGNGRFDSLYFESALAEDYDAAEDRPWQPALELGEEGYLSAESYAPQDDEDPRFLGEVQSAEHEAAAASDAEWLEAEWLEAPAGSGAGETIEAFCERLGREWSQRLKGEPSADAMRRGLLRDHEDTLAAARLRWRGKAGTPDLWERVTRAWMVGREEAMRFKTEGGRGGASVDLAPPAARVPLVADRLVGGSLDSVDRKGRSIAGAKVAPFTLRFARALRGRHKTVGMTNYPRHGGGAFNDRGYSLDLWLSGTDARGFYRHDEALRLLRAIDAAARAVDAQWRVIYNDFAAADAINRELGRRHVIFKGDVRRNKAKQVTGLNWHGPAPLLLHFHLDVVPRSGVDEGEAEGFGEAVQSGGCGCAKCRGRVESAWLQEDEDWNGEEEEWQVEQFGAHGEDEEEAFEPEDEAYGEDEEEATDLASAGLTDAEYKAIRITSALETGKPGGFDGLTGNGDGQGISFGLVNWTIGTGSLQPLLRDFAREQPARWAAVFGAEAERFRTLIQASGADALKRQLRFAQQEMNATRSGRKGTVWYVRQPWRDHFGRLAADPAFRAIQIRHVRPMLAKADDYCRRFGLKSEMAFTFMYDAVASHGGAWLTKKFADGKRRRQLLLDQKLRERGAGATPLAEGDLLLLIADVIGATVRPKYAAQARRRKRWFVVPDEEQERKRGLTGLRPRPDIPYALSRPEQAQQEEELAWLAYEEGEDFSAGEDDEDLAGEQEAFETDFAPDQEDEWQPSQAFEEALEDAVAESGLDTFYDEEAGCGAPFPDHCSGYAPGYEARIRRAGTAKGEVMDRTEGDRTERLALQFRDYDVNAYLPGTKETHAFELPRIIAFIEERAAKDADVRVTITGSASKTGTRCFNQRLSEKRAACMGAWIRSLLTRRALAKTTIDTAGTGFTQAEAEGKSGELPGFRSVLVSVSGRDRPRPIPPEPPGWDKYSIRCCSFSSQAIGTALIDDLLGKLPKDVPPGAARSLIAKLRRRIEQALKRLLRRLPKLGALVGDIARLLRFLPIEISRQRAVFQVRERGNQNPRSITLCYEGHGGRLALGIPGDIDDALDEWLKKVPFLGDNKTMRDSLRALIKRELQDILPERVNKLMSKLDSAVPGPWKDFDLSRRAQIEVFRGPADLFIDVVSGVMDPGSIFLAFDGREWNRPGAKLALRCAKGCAGSVIQLQVDGGIGFDLLSVNTGQLKTTGCSCLAEKTDAQEREWEESLV